MTTNERTAGGALGRFAGKVKEKAGELTGNEELAREGRLQRSAADASEDAAREAAEARQAQEQADLEAEKAANHEERERLEAEVAATRREHAAEQDRARVEAEASQRAER